MNLRHRKKYFNQFRTILVNRHRQNYGAYQQQGQIVTDNLALSFGRYLRAARVNAALSQQDLAQLSGLSHATITALEQGLILSGNIKPQWLHRLSLALNEDIASLNLLLGRLPNETITPVASNQWVALVKGVLPALYPKSNPSAKPVYATLCFTVVLCIAVGTLLSVGNIYPKTSPPPYPRNTLINVSSSDRLNLVKAEFQMETYQQVISHSLPDKRVSLENQYSPVKLTANAQGTWPFTGVY